MKPWEKLATATTCDGSHFELLRHEGNYVIHADGFDLMTSYSHGSEDAMMSLACPRPRADACILNRRPRDGLHSCCDARSTAAWGLRGS